MEIGYEKYYDFLPFFELLVGGEESFSWRSPLVSRVLTRQTGNCSWSMDLVRHATSCCVLHCHNIAVVGWWNIIIAIRSRGLFFARFNTHSKLVSICTVIISNLVSICHLLPPHPSFLHFPGKAIVVCRNGLVIISIDGPPPFSGQKNHNYFGAIMFRSGLG